MKGVYGAGVLSFARVALGLVAARAAAARGPTRAPSVSTLGVKARRGTRQRPPAGAVVELEGGGGGAHQHGHRNLGHYSARGAPHYCAPRTPGARSPPVPVSDFLSAFGSAHADVR